MPTTVEEIQACKVSTISVDGRLSESLTPRMTRQTVGTYLNTNWVLNGAGRFDRDQDIPECPHAITRTIAYWDTGIEITYRLVQSGGYPPLHPYSQVEDNADIKKWASAAKFFDYGDGEIAWINTLRHSFTNYHLDQSKGMEYFAAYEKAMLFIKQALPHLSKTCDRLIESKKKGF